MTNITDIEETKDVILNDLLTFQYVESAEWLNIGIDSESDSIYITARITINQDSIRHLFEKPNYQLGIQLPVFYSPRLKKVYISGNKEFTNALYLRNDTILVGHTNGVSNTLPTHQYNTLYIDTSTDIIYYRTDTDIKGPLPPYHYEIDSPDNIAWLE